MSDYDIKNNNSKSVQKYTNQGCCETLFKNRMHDVDYVTYRIGKISVVPNGATNPRVVNPLTLENVEQYVALLNDMGLVCTMKLRTGAMVRRCGYACKADSEEWGTYHGEKNCGPLYVAPLVKIYIPGKVNTPNAMVVLFHAARYADHYRGLITTFLRLAKESSNVPMIDRFMLAHQSTGILESGYLLKSATHNAVHYPVTQERLQKYVLGDKNPWIGSHFMFPMKQALVNRFETPEHWATATHPSKLFVDKKQPTLGELVEARNAWLRREDPQVCVFGGKPVRETLDKWE